MRTAPSRETVVASLTLFSSLTTLLCCALPAALVAVGAGAALAGLITAVPQLVVLSEHKTTVFAVAGIALALAGIFRLLNRNAPCPANAALARACRRARRVGGVVLTAALAIYGVAFFFAFIAAAFL